MIGWPAALWLVRHGESEGNVANNVARERGALRLEVDVNDIEIPLSADGADQARALGRWFARMDPADGPNAVLVSPYVRARQTADLVLAEAGLNHLPVTVDERLRDREQGVLDRLTFSGFEDRYPEEAERRAYLGKFWFRPAGGESWADVALRLRAALLDLRMAMEGQRILVVTHDVTVLLARYVLEQLSVEEAVALSGEVRNCSVTSYRLDGDHLVLEGFNQTEALEQDDEAAVTAHE
jgi:broad specificity phosphatase PhoE